MKILVLVLVAASVLTTACQTGNGRNVASQDVVQVPVIPRDSTIKFNTDVIFSPGQVKKILTSTAAPVTGASGQPVKTRCTIEAITTVKPNQKLQLSGAKEYTLRETRVTPTYIDQAAPATSGMMSTYKVQYVFAENRSTPPTPVPLIMSCEECAVDTAGNITSTCTNSTPIRIQAFLSSLSYSLHIGDGPSVVNLPKETELIPIRYEQAPRVEGAIEI